MRKKIRDNRRVHYSTFEKWIKLLDAGDLEVLRKDFVKIKSTLEKPKEAKTYIIDKVTGETRVFVEGKAEEFRRSLIEKQTDAEKKFKTILKSLKIGYEFQKIFYYTRPGGNSFYIVDFYIPSKEVVIEIDGGYHNTDNQVKLDRQRTKVLKKEGIEEVIRFTNNNVLLETQTVIEELKNL